MLKILFSNASPCRRDAYIIYGIRASSMAGSPCRRARFRRRRYDIIAETFAHSRFMITMTASLLFSLYFSRPHIRYFEIFYQLLFSIASLMAYFGCRGRAISKLHFADAFMTAGFSLYLAISRYFMLYIFIWEDFFHVSYRCATLFFQPYMLLPITHAPLWLFGQNILAFSKRQRRSCFGILSL